MGYRNGGRARVRRVLAAVVLLVNIAVVTPVRAVFAFDPAPVLVQESETLVAPGVVYRVLAGQTAAGEPLLVNVLEIDPSQQGVQIYPVAAGALGSRSSLSRLAADGGAVAAINGGFFVTSGGKALPVGHLVLDGQPLAGWDVWRPSVGFTDGGLKMGYFAPGMTLTLPAGGVIAIDQLNYPPREGETVLYTPAWGPATGTPPQRAELVLEGKLPGPARVTAVGQGNAAIPADGLVVSLAPDRASGLKLAPGDLVRLDYTYDPWWGQVEHLLTGGPLLVEGGRPVFQAVAEGFTGTVLKPNPRTALGRTGAGRVLAVTVDGRQPGVSAGLTLEEMALLMAGLGAEEAVGLDGGGSTAMWVNGQVVNNLSDGAERLLPTALLVRSGAPVFLNGQRLYFDVQPRVVDDRTMVPLRGVFEALGAQVAWDFGTRNALVNREGLAVRLDIDKGRTWVNGQEISLDVPARIIDARTMVPLRFLAENLGAVVIWNGEKRWVEIYDTPVNGDQAPAPPPGTI